MPNESFIGTARSSNAFARARDERVLWFLARHPTTAGMLTEIGWFPSKKKALRRLRRLVQKKQVRLLGTVSFKDGRPEHVYCRGRWKADNVLHEVQLTRLCLKIHADEIRRGQSEVDRCVLPDAELWINGQRYFLEMDCGTMSYPKVMQKRFTKYRSVPELVLWVSPSESRTKGLRRHADMLRETALFTTLERALSNPHAPIWTDFQGAMAALPKTKRVGNNPGEKGGEKGEEKSGTLSPPASGGATTTL